MPWHSFPKLNNSCPVSCEYPQFIGLSSELLGLFCRPIHLCSAYNQVPQFTDKLLTMTITQEQLESAEQQIVFEHQIREKVINEEFKIWKKSVPLLYDTIHTQALKWPLLTAQFFPGYTVSENKNFITLKLAIGSHSSSKNDVVQVATIDLPSTLAPNYSAFSLNESIPAQIQADGASPIQFTHSWRHPGEVNTLKVSPDGSKIITFDNTGAVHLFEQDKDASSDYLYHASEGYALEWTNNSQFLSGANDGKIALWDVGTTTSPTKTFTSHSAVINNLSHSKPSDVLFGSVSDDFETHIHDIRAPEESPVIKIVNGQIQNAIAFHPLLQTLFATAGKDNVVNLYDARKVSEPFRKLFGHNDSVVGLVWSGENAPNLLNSWGLDKRVITWDLTELSEDFVYPTAAVNDSKRKPRSTEDPCLAFVHGGHTNRINDLAVSSSIEGLFATVGDDTLLEIYKPKSKAEDEDEEEEEEEEEDEREREEEDVAEDEEKERDGPLETTEGNDTPEPSKDVEMTD